SAGCPCPRTGETSHGIHGGHRVSGRPRTASRAPWGGGVPVVPRVLAGRRVANGPARAADAGMFLLGSPRLPGSGGPPAPVRRPRGPDGAARLPKSTTRGVHDGSAEPQEPQRSVRGADPGALARRLRPS